MMWVTPMMTPLAWALSLGLAWSSSSVMLARKPNFVPRMSGYSLKNRRKMLTPWTTGSSRIELVQLCLISTISAGLEKLQCYEESWTKSFSRSEETKDDTIEK